MKSYIVALPVGSVGKTTIARHILAAHAPSPAILSIESASPAGDEVEILNRDDERGVRVLKTRLFAAHAQSTTIIDAGVTDSELAAQVLRDLMEMDQLLTDVTVVLPYLAGKKSASGLEKFAAKLPAAVRKVLVYSQARDGERGFGALRATKAELGVAEFCGRAGIDICPTPVYYCPLLDTDSPYHSLLGVDGIAGVASIDLDALRAKAGKVRGDMDAEARLGLALDGVGFAKRALANLRAVYEYLARPARAAN